MLGNPIFVHACWLTMILFAMNSTDSALQTKDQASQNNNSKIEQLPNSVPAEIDKEQQPNEAITAITAAEQAAITATTAAKQIEQQQKLKFHGMVANTQLYYIGIYESNAQEYTIEEQRSRKAECESSQLAQDCWEYAYRAKKDVEKTVTVHVNSQRNTSLILSSYEPVKWIITGNTQRVKFIYLTGYHASDVSIFSINSKNIYASFYEGSTCSYCLISNLKYFHGYSLDSNIQNVAQDYFGKPVDLFQGQYKASKFYVN